MLINIWLIFQSCDFVTIETGWRRWQYKCLGSMWYVLIMMPILAMPNHCAGHVLANLPCVATFNRRCLSKHSHCSFMSGSGVELIWLIAMQVKTFQIVSNSFKLVLICCHLWYYLHTYHSTPSTDRCLGHNDGDDIAIEWGDDYSIHRWIGWLSP